MLREPVCCTGDKSEAKALMKKADVPVVPGYHGSDQAMNMFLHCFTGRFAKAHSAMFI